MVTGYQNGTISQLLQAIIGQINFDGEPISNIGDILLSILEQTPYDDEPKSVLAELFLKLKDKLEGRAFTPYDKEPQSAIAEILLSILNVTPYDKEPNSRIAELLLELKAELESYVILTSSGAIANFTTSLALPLVSLKASIVATESGSGTKSPTNPYTLGGFSNAVITKSGVNLWDEVWENGYINASGQEQVAINSIRSANYCPCVSGSTLYVVSFASPSLYVILYDKNKAFITRALGNNQSISVPNNACYFRVSVYGYGTTYNHDISLNYPSTDTTYHAYIATQTTLALGQTVYGGEIVLTKKASGYGVKLRVYPHYPSYNGETLTGKWLSSMDNYVAGTTPTIGADVVDLSGAVYTEIDLTDASDIVALVGTNNVWSDTGDMEVEYYAAVTDNIEQTSKSRAAAKAEKELKAKLEKELKELDEKETIKEPTKEIGETKK